LRLTATNWVSSGLKVLRTVKAPVGELEPDVYAPGLDVAAVDESAAEVVRRVSAAGGEGEAGPGRQIAHLNENWSPINS